MNSLIFLVAQYAIRTGAISSLDWLKIKIGYYLIRYGVRIPSKILKRRVEKHIPKNKGDKERLLRLIEAVGAIDYICEELDKNPFDTLTGVVFAAWLQGKRSDGTSDRLVADTISSDDVATKVFYIMRKLNDVPRKDADRVIQNLKMKGIYINS